jgi:hypothetical protein
MPSNQPDKSEAITSGGQLVEFVDPAHEVTEEERNRPRYGRPKRPTDSEPSPQPPTTSESTPPAE